MEKNRTTLVASPIGQYGQIANFHIHKGDSREFERGDSELPLKSARIGGKVICKDQGEFHKNIP